MPEPLDVLVIESHPGEASLAAHALETAGHSVHRCHDDHSRAFPCRGVVDPATCPLGPHIDVALLVRRRVGPRPTVFEQGVSCAIRAGIPLVESGPAALDPYEPYVTARAGADVVGVCQRASDAARDQLRREILRLTAPILRAAGVSDRHVVCTLEPEVTRLHVEFDLPLPVDAAVKQALAVRVLDAVRGAGRTYGSVEVSVHAGRTRHVVPSGADNGT